MIPPNDQCGTNQSRGTRPRVPQPGTEAHRQLLLNMPHIPDFQPSPPIASQSGKRMKL